MTPYRPMTVVDGRAVEWKEEDSGTINKRRPNDMAHHSSQISPEIAALFREHYRGGPTPAETLGPTGRFPEGKLTENDEGETRVGITHIDGKVVIDFGKPTAWIGFTADQADDIADTLRKHAAAIRVANG